MCGVSLSCIPQKTEYPSPLPAVRRVRFEDVQKAFYGYAPLFDLRKEPYSVLLGLCKQPQVLLILLSDFPLSIRRSHQQRSLCMRLPQEAVAPEFWVEPFRNLLRDRQTRWREACKYHDAVWEFEVQWSSGSGDKRCQYLDCYKSSSKQQTRCVRECLNDIRTHDTLAWNSGISNDIILARNESVPDPGFPSSQRHGRFESSFIQLFNCGSFAIHSHVLSCRLFDVLSYSVSWIFSSIDSHARECCNWEILAFFSFSSSISSSRFCLCRISSWILVRDSFPSMMSKEAASTSTKSRCFFRESMMQSNRLPKSFQRERNIICHAIVDSQYATSGQGGAQLPLRRKNLYARWWKSRIVVYTVARTCWNSRLLSKAFL